jgi:hypothetical protein
MGIRDVTAEVWERVQEAVQTAIEFVRPYIEEFVTTVRAWWDENWPAIQATFEQVWNAILSVVQYVVGLVGPFITETFGQVVGWVQANWPLILQTIQTVLDAVWGVVQTVLGAIEQFWTDHGAKIKTVVETAWEIVKTVITTALATIGDVIKAVMQAINGDWEGAWETIKGAAERIWEAIGTVIENAIEVIETTVAIVWETIQPKLIEAWNAIQTKTSEVWSAVVGAVEGAWAKLSPVLDAIAGGFGWVTGAIDAVKGAINGFIGAMANLAGIEVPSWLQIHSPPELAQGFTMIGEAASFAGAQISGAFGAGVLELSTGGILAFVESLKKLIYAWEGMFKTKQEMRVLNQAVDMIKKWEDIGAGLKGAAEGLAALMGYSGGLLQKTVNQFISDTMMVINGLLDYVESGVKRAAAIADRFGQSLSIITGAISMLDTLRDYTGPAKEQLDEFGVDLFDITQIIVDLAAHFDQYAVDAAAVFSESAGQIGEAVGQAVGGLIDVAGYAGATPMAFERLREDLHTAVTMMDRMAGEFEIEGVEAAARFSESAGVIARAIGDAVGGMAALMGYGGAGKLDWYNGYWIPQLRFLEEDLRLVVGMMQRLAEDFNGAGLEAAVTFAEAVNVIIDAIRDALKALMGIGEYEGLGSNLGTFIADLKSVIAELQALQVAMVDTSGLFALTDSLFSADNIGYPSSSSVTVNVDAASADPWAVAELTAAALRTEVRYS